MSTALAFTVRMPVPYVQALQQTRSALQAAGFGIITEIDMRATFAEKLGREFRLYIILGACNPPLAFAALSANAEVGLLLAAPRHLSLRISACAA